MQTPIYAASGRTPSPSSPAQASEHSDDAAGAQTYAKNCAICHGEKREGNLPSFPPLLGIGHRMTNPQIADLVHSGKGRMPGFPKLQNEELTGLLRFLASDDLTPAAGGSASATSGLADAGGAIFQRNCAFCHGRDAEGGETGPDLTRSKLVLADVAGNNISEVVRNGRPEKKMPAFNFSTQEMETLTAFIHEQVAKASTRKGGRRGVDVSDLQTGNAEAGKQYFNGAGTCSKCHSATGDLADIARRYEGLDLEKRMLYPRDVKSHVTVTLPSGQKITGTLAYLDEFTVGLRDDSGRYRSWSTSRVKYAVDAPVNAHVELFSQYPDADIHNVMAYLQTLR
mgnify:CR=1 FL=1